MLLFRFTLSLDKADYDDKYYDRTFRPESWQEIVKEFQDFMNTIYSINLDSNKLFDSQSINDMSIIDQEEYSKDDIVKTATTWLNTHHEIAILLATIDDPCYTGPIVMVDVLRYTKIPKPKVLLLDFVDFIQKYYKLFFDTDYQGWGRKEDPERKEKLDNYFKEVKTRIQNTTNRGIHGHN